VSGVSGVLAIVLIAVAAPVLAAAGLLLYLRARAVGDIRLELRSWPFVIAACAADVVGYWLIGFTAGAAVSAVIGLAGVWLWWDSWRKNRRRKRAPGLAGYKARAAIASLVRRSREAARPRPVLRPVPGGAR
jgi:hypothetical protein